MRRRHNLNNMNDLFLSLANGSVRGLQQYLYKGGTPDLKDSTHTNLLHKVCIMFSVTLLIICHFV